MGESIELGRQGSSLRRILNQGPRSWITGKETIESTWSPQKSTQIAPKRFLFFTERRCSFLSPPHFGEFIGDCSSVHGSVCRIQCLAGYVLQGSDQTTCEFDGTNTYWQRDETPSCNLVTCDALSLPAGVQINPAFCAVGRLTVGTQCSFYCLNSLSLSGNVSSVVCEDDGTWNAELSDLPTHCEGNFRLCQNWQPQLRLWLDYWKFMNIITIIINLFAQIKRMPATIMYLTWHFGW